MLVEFRTKSSWSRVKLGSKVLVEVPISSPILKDPKKLSVLRSQKVRMSLLFSESLLIATFRSLNRFGVIGSLGGLGFPEQKSSFFFPVNSWVTRSDRISGGLSPRVRWICRIPDR